MEYLTGLGIGLVTGYLGKWVISKLPALISKEIGSKLNEILDINNPEDRDLVLGWVKWAEKKLPGKGDGFLRKELLMSFLGRIFPTTVSSILSEIIEVAVVTMKLELGKAK